MVKLFTGNFNARLVITFGHVSENSPGVVQPAINISRTQLHNLESLYEKLVARLRQPLAEID